MPKFSTLRRSTFYYGTYLLIGLLVAALIWWGGIPLAKAIGWIDDSGRPTIDPTLISAVRPSTGTSGETERYPPGVSLKATLTPSVLQAKLAALPVTGAGTVGWLAIDATQSTDLSASAADTMFMPASTMKVFTAITVIDLVGSDTRFDTRVVENSSGSIVLVGGGDPFLTSKPVEKGWFHPSSLAELADQTVKKLMAKGINTVNLGYDSSLFTGPGWASQWEEVFRYDQSEVSALIADRGQNLQTKQFSSTPALDAATKFSTELQTRGIKVSGEPVEVKGNGVELAKVSSPNTAQLIRQCLLHSDNIGTEIMLRHAAQAAGRSPSFVDAWTTLREHLNSVGLLAKNAVISDGSGVSRADRISPRMLTGAMQLIATTATRKTLLDAFPVAGVSGTLQKRFTANSTLPARGVVRAKSGSLRDVTALAGMVTTADGQLVVFAVMSNGYTDPTAAKEWSETVAATIAGCGCR